MGDKIGLDFFARVTGMASLQARGDALYCLKKKADIEKNAYDSDICRIAGNGEMVRLTASGDVGSYALLDDGIVFPAARAQKDKDAIKAGEALTVFQRLPYDGGEALEYLRLPHTVVQAVWLPDGGLLFRAVLDHGWERLLKQCDGDREKALKAMKEEGEALTVMDELPFWFNGDGFINKKRTALYLYRDGEAKLLSDPFANIDWVELSPGATRALFAQQTYTDVAPDSNALYALDITTGELSPVAGLPLGYAMGYAFDGEDSALVLTLPEDAPHGMVAGNPSLYRVSLHGGNAFLLDDSGRYSCYNSVNTDIKMGDMSRTLTFDGGKALFLTTLFGDSHIMTYDTLTGRFEQVTGAPGAVQDFIPYKDGYAMIALRGNHPAEVYTISAAGDETRLTHENDALMAAAGAVTPIPFSYTNKEGTEIHGWVMPPIGHLPGEQHPAILNIHGGPKTVYGSVLFHEMQYWCAEGYAVLFLNPTGGDGRGGGFADIRGRYGTVDYDDIMGFVDAALARFDFLDASRLGVTGGSYGGFMTNWIIGHTDRFRAAASQRSIANWIGFANTSDIGREFAADQMQGTPWNDTEKLWNASPLKYADRVKTPTLFIHSEEDYRCNMFEGIQMFYALRVHGVETRLCLFKGENHNLSRAGKPKNRMRRLDEITRWMDRFLK